MGMKQASHAKGVPQGNVEGNIWPKGVKQQEHGENGILL
jgi:hypothetical protein